MLCCNTTIVHRKAESTKYTWNKGRMNKGNHPNNRIVEGGGRGNWQGPHTIKMFTTIMYVKNWK